MADTPVDRIEPGRETTGFAPLLDWNGPLGSPRFDLITPDMILPALRAAIADHAAEREAIAGSAEPADFENTFVALERSGARLARVRRLFYMLTSAQADPAIRAIEEEVSALLTAHGSRGAQDPRLFARIAGVHAQRARSDLSSSQVRLVERIYDGFIAGGAALDDQGKARLAEIDTRLAKASIAFSQNVMAVTNGWSLIVDADDLTGLPAPVVAAAAARAEAAGHAGGYAIGLDRTDYEAFLTFSDRRDLRERLWHAFVGRCTGGGEDNRPLIAEILALRQEAARLLGYPDYATMRLKDSMAATPEAAQAFLMRLWAPAVRKAMEEASLLQRRINAGSAPYRLEPWDWRFHAEQVRVELYALDGAALREHLRLDAVRAAAFATARRLYGLTFVERPDLPVYHPDVQAWEVRDEAHSVGILYTDYLARPEKHGGAWMGSLRVQERMDGPVLPIVYVVANFAGALDRTETRLSLDEARTLFHEFGHALHALLSDVTYPSQAGTMVARDFVEFPSKLMEHWISDAALLAPMGVPADLIAAIDRADDYGQGFATVELTAASLVDLALHRASDVVDPLSFADHLLDGHAMPPMIVMRHQLPVFTHIFDGGYASAYYSYLWSEMLDWDAFAAFTETRDIFDAGVGARFRAEILAPGDSRDPAGSFAAFRGRSPREAYLLAARGLIDETIVEPPDGRADRG